MSNKQNISGFSKLSKTDKISWVAKNFLYANPIDLIKEFAEFWHESIEEQKLFDGFSENTLTNFYLPFGVAPNFKINNQVYCIPMVIEESSVVAAASNAAKFWLNRGGFKTKVLSTKKEGQVHFIYNGAAEKLKMHFEEIKTKMIADCEETTANMEKRGGGIEAIELLDFTEKESGYFQIKAQFETCDSMGANFINSVLESFSNSLKEYIECHDEFVGYEKEMKVVMSILSNYTPECLTDCSVECDIKDLEGSINGMNPYEFADKFSTAVRIANVDPYRAATHNKGIMNGIDAVVIATGNDFRAVESSMHAYAARNGSYGSLSMAEVKDDKFKFALRAPLALGTVGGLTKLHPLAKKSLELLGNPSAEELMQIVAAVGLAQNFAAVKSLVTTGIQQGHMKMHLNNILATLKATEEEAVKVKAYFMDKVVSFSAVSDFLKNHRNSLA